MLKKLNEIMMDSVLFLSLLKERITKKLAYYREQLKTAVRVWEQIPLITELHT